MLDILEIQARLPHRYPFLLVDRILEAEGNRVVGIKNVTINEPFFQGHFPQEPVMPGVLVLEAMGQVASIIVSLQPGFEKMVAFLTSVEEAKFRRPVRPGDQLRTEAELVKFRSRMGKIHARGTVDGELVAEATLGFVLSRTLTKGTEEERP
ncbi:3-hydroxyacyl-ACP dehydratase FabZ [Aminomonas paucivorans]|uniref:3-hydroxyacyl-[acyl-carrier-protein] dehydratase FabZ n=1 Tax=Aminomonas paucivorans DSM 12260 TaxID=584708 RepID=E3CW68_9BACT|nr:3-hydroxyacyl-(acyl-carrier-protein) dehydratase [Aminomonas paucivorans DSM 12260]